MKDWLKDIALDEWVAYVFDHPVGEPVSYCMPTWYWSTGAEPEEPPPAAAVQYLIQLFRSPEVSLARFSDAQLDQGFSYLGSGSSYMYALLERDVPWTRRQECIRAMETLFKLLFAKRCSAHLSHNDEPGASPLNSSCYMWWDSFPSWGNPTDTSSVEFDKEILEVVRRILSVDSTACQESALHGLGHWQMYYPKQVESTIDDYLKRQTHLRVELRNYALNARQGYVQ